MVSWGSTQLPAAEHAAPAILQAGASQWCGELRNHQPTASRMLCTLILFHGFRGRACKLSELFFRRHTVRREKYFFSPQHCSPTTNCAFAQAQDKSHVQNNSSKNVQFLQHCFSEIGDLVFPRIKVSWSKLLKFKHYISRTHNRQQTSRNSLQYSITDSKETNLRKKRFKPFLALDFLKEVLQYRLQQGYGFSLNSFSLVTPCTT